MTTYGSPRDEIRALMSRYPSDPDRTRAALDAALAPVREPAPAEIAASVLGDLGFTAGDVLDALAADGTITILPLGPADEDQVMDAAAFSPAERAIFRAALDIPGDCLTPRQRDLMIRYEDARESF